MSDIRLAASRPHIASSSAISSNISTSRWGASSGTTPAARPHLDESGRSQLDQRFRMGVLDTRKRAASSVSSSLLPGGMRPVAISSSIFREARTSG
jgi:hypothetical protein